MLKLVLFVFVLLASAARADAQITAPNTFTSNTPALASEVNANFDALESASLNRTGGTITGNIAVDAGVTIDGVDVSALLGGTGTPTFSTVTATTVTGNLIGNVTGNLTGQVVTAAQTSITSIANLATVGTITSGTWSGSFGAVSGTTLTGIAKLASANTFSAYNKFLTVAETSTAPAIAGSALTINLALGTQFQVSSTGNATITLSNPNTSGDGGFFTIFFTNDGTARTFTWPAAVRWSEGVAYAATGTLNKIDVVQCLYNNGGTSYLCTAVKNF